MKTNPFADPVTTTSCQSRGANFRVAAHTRSAILAIAAVAALVAAVLVTGLIHARKERQRHGCVGNLLQIQGAKESWALEHKASNTTRVVWSDVTPFLKNSTVPVCPAGGVYALGVAGTNIVCSIRGHCIPTNEFQLEFVGRGPSRFTRYGTLSSLM